MAKSDRSIARTPDRGSDIRHRHGHNILKGGLIVCAGVALYVCLAIALLSNAHQRYIAIQPRARILPPSFVRPNAENISAVQRESPSPDDAGDVRIGTAPAPEEQTKELMMKSVTTVHDARGHSYEIRVNSFSDSRCKKGVTCIWQGELGVQLDVTEGVTGESQEVLLGTVRATQASIFGLNLTLHSIDMRQGEWKALVSVE